MNKMQSGREVLEKPGKVVNILLVEDNPGDVRLIRESLAESRGLEFDLRVATSICAAESYLAVESFDVLLLDLSLPESNGQETFDRAQSSAGSLPVIILTGTDDCKMAGFMKEHRALEYLVKGSVSALSIVRTIRRAVGIEQIENPEKFREKPHVPGNDLKGVEVT